MTEQTITQLRAELAQARADLKDLQGANRSLGRQVADMTENREFWYKEAHATMSAAEGLRRQLANIKAQLETSEQQVIEWKDAWMHSTKLRRKANNTTAQLSERLATLDAAEAALADAKQRHKGTIDELEQRLTRMRKRLAQAELEAHVHDKACGELAQTARTERVLRQKVEREIRQYNIALSTTSTEAAKLRQRAERAEALAQLMTPRLASLLDRLARFADASWGPELTQAARDGKDTAAQIREALDDNQA